MFVPESLEELNESIDDILKGKSLIDIKDQIIEKIDRFIEERRIFKFSTNVFNSGPGKIRQEQFLKSLPLKVNAGPNFYYSISDNSDMISRNVMYSTLKGVYGIQTFNINKIMGPIINVPFEEEWIEIKPKEIRTYSLFVYLKKEKIILEFYRNKKNGRTGGTEPNKIYFDYDNLKEELNK